MASASASCITGSMLWTNLTTWAQFPMIGGKMEESDWIRIYVLVGAVMLWVTYLVKTCNSPCSRKVSELDPPKGPYPEKNTCVVKLEGGVATVQLTESEQRNLTKEWYRRNKVPMAGDANDNEGKEIKQQILRFASLIKRFARKVYNWLWMKIDRSKIKRSTTKVPPDCKTLLLRIVDCKETSDLTELLKGVQTWTYGKCELYHWIDALDRFDGVLGKATHRADGRWAMACDVSDNEGKELKLCVLQILRFSSLLIEHSLSFTSFTRIMYNSIDHLTELLYSSDLTLLLENLHLLFMFSKRSNLLTRLPDDKRSLLLEGLYALAESWGGKEAGFGLAACCLKRPLKDYPPTATTVHMEFYRDAAAARNRFATVLHIDDVHTLNKLPSRILDECIDNFDVPQDKQLSLLTHLRLAYYFPVWSERVKLVQARLQALSILVYANAIQENTQQLLYRRLMEELVDILKLSQDYLTDIKAAALRTLTSIIHLDQAHNIPNIIEATGAGSYHGFLPKMVRNCINSLTSSTPDASQQHPPPLATALFSFLYHLASYELGRKALGKCGMLESLLKVVNWETSDVEYITFVTRAVRVIDLILTNTDMQAFQAHNGLAPFINRLEFEVAACRADQGPFEAVATTSTGVPAVNPGSASNFVHNGTTCLPQRAALLKSMLNFLKKVIQDSAFSDSIRHIMEGSLPNSLKHIICNAEYYGASPFLLALVLKGMELRDLRKNLTPKYPFGGPNRVSIPEDKIEWNTPWTKYNPPEFTTASILQGDKEWADKKRTAKWNKGLRPKWNQQDGGINRRSHHGNYKTDSDGYPLNPAGRTGIKGRGSLGRWATNHAADCLITRWKKAGDGTIITREGRPILQFIGIRRKDTEDAAFPGGTIAAGEDAMTVVKREFLEEVFSIDDATDEKRQELEEAFRLVLADGDSVYKGYVDDRRNTDNAWIETEAINFSLNDSNDDVFRNLKFKAGNDAKGAFWIDIDRKVKLYASHKSIIQILVQKLDAYW